MVDNSTISLDVSAELKNIENEPPRSQIQYGHAWPICTNIFFKIQAGPTEGGNGLAARLLHHVAYQRAFQGPPSIYQLRQR